MYDEYAAVLGHIHLGVFTKSELSVHRARTVTGDYLSSTTSPRPSSAPDEGSTHPVVRLAATPVKLDLPQGRSILYSSSVAASLQWRQRNACSMSTTAKRLRAVPIGRVSCCSVNYVKVLHRLDTIAKAIPSHRRCGIDRDQKVRYSTYQCHQSVFDVQASIRSRGNWCFGLTIHLGTCSREQCPIVVM